MATSNNRDVELRIAATASGNEQIKKLADEVEALAKKGGSAAPEFQKLSSELDKIATQDAAIKQLQELDAQVSETSKALVAAQSKVKELGTAFEQQKASTDSFKTAQAAAREEVAKTEEKLRAAKAELTTFRAESDQSARATNEYKVRLGELRKAVGDLQVELESNKALAGTKSDLKELEVETRKAERAFTAAKKEAEALQTQLQTQATAASQVTKALTDIGVETTDLGAAQKKLTSEVIATASAFKTAADEQTKYEAKLANIAAKNEVAVASAKKLGSEVADAAKKSAAAQAEAASQYEAAALRVKLSQEEVAAKAKLAGQALENAFSTLNVRSAEAIKTEIEGVKTALATLGNSGQLSAGQLKTAFETAQAKVDALNRELAGIPAAAEKANAAFGILRQSLSQLTAAFGAFEAARAFIDAANNAETLSRSLNLLLGDAKLANEQIAFLRDRADKAGLSVGVLTKDFVNFTAALNTSGVSLETQRELFTSVTNAAGQLGISTDRVGLILQAFSQTANKGKVTLEELQGQLGESLPGVLQVVANGFGVTKDRVLELVKAGVDVNDFFDAFIVGSNKAFGDGSQKVESFAAAWNRLKNAFDKFSAEASQSTAFKALISVIDGLAANFNTVANAAVIAAEAFALFKFTEYVKGFLGLRDATTLAKAGQDALTGSIATSTAAKGADTVATNANTKAIELNTAAQATNKAAWSALAADLGKTGAAKAEVAKQAGVLDKALGVAATGLGLFGTAVRGALGLIGGLPGLFVLTALNAKTLGTAIADQVAEWTGLAEKVRKGEQALKDYDAQQAANRIGQREAERQTRLTAYAMEGLNKEAVTLVDNFKEVEKKTGSTSKALEELKKDLRFDDFSGLTAAAQALGRLQQEGKLAADEVKKIFAGAAEGQDLLKFETTVTAAFSTMRNGATLVKSALDAIAEESLKQVGSSVRELETGYSAAFISAQNNTDKLSATLKTLGAGAEQTSTLLTKALNKELEAASTSKALDEVVARVQQIGSTGKLADSDIRLLFDNGIKKALEFAKTETDLKKVEAAIKEIIAANPQLGASFSDALDKVKSKLNEINPQLRQLQKDAELLGVKLGDSTNQGVEKSVIAYERLKASGKASSDTVREAFINLAKTATESAGGIIPEWVKVEAQYRNVDLATIDLGESIKRYGGAAQQASGAAIIAMSGAESATRSLIGTTDELIRKEQELARERERNRLNVDRDGFTKDSSGNRMTMQGDTYLSAYNALKSGGASEEQARAIASKYFPNQGQGVSMSAIRDANNRAGYGGFGNLGTALQQEISDLARGGQLGKSPQQDNINQLNSLRTEFANLTKELVDLKEKARGYGYKSTPALDSLLSQVGAGSNSLKSFLPGVSPFTLNRFSKDLAGYKSQLGYFNDNVVPITPVGRGGDTSLVPPNSGSSGYTVTINLGGASRTINAASASDAQALVNLLQQIGAAASRSGPGGP